MKSERVGAAPDLPPTQVMAWYTVVILMLLYVCSYMDRAVLTMLIAPIQRQMGITDFEISLLIGPIFGIVYTGLGLIAGWLADRINRRHLLAIGAALWGLATAMSGFAGTYLHLAFARLAVGVGEATLTPVAHSLIAEQFPPRRLSTAISVYSLGVTFGSGLALAFSGAMVDVAGGLIATTPWLHGFQPWQLVFLLVATPTLLLVPCIYTFRATSRPTAHHAAPTAPRGAFFRKYRRLLIPYFLGYGFTGISTSAMLAWTPIYMSRTFGLSMGEIGVGFGLTILLGTGIGQMVGSLVVDHLYARGVRDVHTRIHIFSWFISAPALALAFSMHSPTLFLVFIGVYFFCTFPFQGYSNAGLQLITPPELRGRMSASFLAFLQFLSTGLGPTSVAFVTDYVLRNPMRVGSSLLCVTLACMPGAVILLFIAMRETRRLHAAEQRVEPLD